MYVYICSLVTQIDCRLFSILPLFLSLENHDSKHDRIQRRQSVNWTPFRIGCYREASAAPPAPIALPASALASASIWVLPGTDTLLSAACDRRACSLSSTLSSVNRAAHLVLSNGQLKLISGAWWESCNGCVITPIS